MLSKEEQFVTITETELAALCFLLSWLTNRERRDDVLPKAFVEVEKFIQRARANIHAG